MNYETAASFGPGSSRAKPSKKQQRKRGDLAAAIRNHQAAIASKGIASRLDKTVMDAATNALIDEVKMKAARR